MFSPLLGSSIALALFPKLLEVFAESVVESIGHYSYLHYSLLREPRFEYLWDSLMNLSSKAMATEFMLLHCSFDSINQVHAPYLQTMFSSRVYPDF